MAFTFGAVAEFVSGIFKPAADLIDELHTSEEEKLKAKTGLLKIEQEVMMKALALEQTLVDAQKEIIIAEAKGSWLQRSWRPVLMWMIMFIIAHNFILAPYLEHFFQFSLDLQLPDWMGNLLTIGVGGYIVGRSGEQIVTKWKK